MEADASSVLSLISRIHTLSAEFTRGELSRSPLGSLDGPRCFILFTLARSGRPLSMGEISARINRDKSTATALVRRLESEGLVETARDGSDSRRRIVSLTAEGRRLGSATEGISGALLGRAWAGFSEAEKESLVAMLARIESNLGGA